MPRSLGSSLRLSQRVTRAASDDGVPDALEEVTLTLLQGFRLEAGDRHVELPLGSQRLVAFLAVHRRPLQRVYIAGSLWPDRDEEKANASLRTTLWRLRQLDFPLIEATRSQLVLSPCVSVDLHESDARAKQVLRRQGSSSPQQLDTLIFDGELLADWYDDWVLLERERFRQIRLHALETLCADYSAAGSHGLAVEAGLACVAAEPLRESAHRTLIKAHCAEANLGEAIRQYRLYCRLLSDQLGLEPSAELRQMVESLPVQ